MRLTIITAPLIIVTFEAKKGVTVWVSVTISVIATTSVIMTISAIVTIWVIKGFRIEGIESSIRIGIFLITN